MRTFGIILVRDLCRISSEQLEISKLQDILIHCVASPPDIGTLEAGRKTNVKSDKVKFFLFSLYSTFC
jgi:hypothetical protein